LLNILKIKIYPINHSEMEKLLLLVGLKKRKYAENNLKIIFCMESILEFYNPLSLFLS